MNSLHDFPCQGGTVLRIAYTTTSVDRQRCLWKAFADAELIYVGSSDLERFLRFRSVHFDGLVLYQGLEPDSVTLRRIAMLKCLAPYVPIVVVMPLDVELWRSTYELGLAGADGLLIEGFEEHPGLIKETLSMAAVNAIASCLEVSSPLPPALSRHNLVHVIKNISALKRPEDLASALGLQLRDLQSQLRAARLFSARTLLAWLRMLVAATRLGQHDSSVEAIGYSLDYASGPAFRNACRKLLAATPSDIRSHGGLQFAVAALRRRLRSRSA